jgi:hypothetical protein
MTFDFTIDAGEGDLPAQITHLFAEHAFISEKIRHSRETVKTTRFVRPITDDAGLCADRE